jgi:deoxyribodipyrimidine photo-lyase
MMTSTMIRNLRNISDERIHHLNACNTMRPGAAYVLYWMQQAQRIRNNHALEAAAQTARANDLPLLTVFVLTDNFPEANLRHYAFLAQGLTDLAQQFAKHGDSFAVLAGDPPAVIAQLAENAAIVITDRGYLRVQKTWRSQLARRIDCPLVEIETDVVVPLETASDHEEFAARTYRPKIHRLLPQFQEDIIARRTRAKPFPLAELRPKGLPADSADALLSALRLDPAVPSVEFPCGGETHALKHLRRFIRERLDDYAALRNDPALEIASGMSPYLHFGHISPLTILHEIQAADANTQSKEAYLEELVVRRELSMNFVHYNPRYDQYNGLPDWARATLDEHRHDPREYLYDRHTFETAATHDPYWNAAQQQLRQTGTMHNYMRMYWGKKFIEWSTSPEQAFENALYLNNQNALDGRDANSFTGVAWCFGKHDRPWTTRPVFGKIRYMNANGLQRKFKNIQRYTTKWTVRL